jgi:5-formyltetrahydrofolate cyclo-ligase
LKPDSQIKPPHDTGPDGATLDESVVLSASRPLRSRLRALRRALSPREQRLHARGLARVLGQERLFLGARRVALYWPADGEIDPLPLLERGAKTRRRAYLPVLHPGRAPRLTFAPYHPGEPLSPNRFGIPEPPSRRGRIHARHLDLLLVPLVGFDQRGQRIGMGGGFYDRSLAFLKRRPGWRRPRLIGLAHECQRLPRIAPRPWDVPLDGIATERRVYWARGSEPQYPGISGETGDRS